MCAYLCVCMRKWERVCVSVCEREKACEWVCVCVCVRVCLWVWGCVYIKITYLSFLFLILCGLLDDFAILFVLGFPMLFLALCLRKSRCICNARTIYMCARVCLCQYWLLHNHKLPSKSVRTYTQLRKTTHTSHHLPNSKTPFYTLHKTVDSVSQQRHPWIWQQRIARWLDIARSCIVEPVGKLRLISSSFVVHIL